MLLSQKQCFTKKYSLKVLFFLKIITYNVKFRKHIATRNSVNIHPFDMH